MNTGGLSQWFERELGSRMTGSPVRLGGGNSNDTFSVATAGGLVVLRIPPDASIDPTANQIAREASVLAAINDTSIPSPRILATCLDTSILGRPFLVLEHMDGVAITESLPSLYEASTCLSAIAAEMVNALVEIHRVDVDEIGLGDLSRRDGFLSRQVPRWTAQLERAGARPLELFDELARWLTANQPPEPVLGLVHGDFHLDNCLFDVSRPRLVTVLDWELAALGPGLLDLALMLAFWGDRPIEPCAMPLVQAVSRRGTGPNRTDVASLYARATGHDLADLGFYLVLALWKLACIVEGAYQSQRSDPVRGEYAARLGHDVPRLLEEAAAFRTWS